MIFSGLFLQLGCFLLGYHQHVNSVIVSVYYEILNELIKLRPYIAGWNRMSYVLFQNFKATSFYNCKSQNVRAVLDRYHQGGKPENACMHEGWMKRFGMQSLLSEHLTLHLTDFNDDSSLVTDSLKFLKEAGSWDQMITDDEIQLALLTMTT